MWAFVIARGRHVGLVLGLGLLAACGGGGPTVTGSPSTPGPGPATPPPSSVVSTGQGVGAEGTARVVAEGVTTTLGVDDCTMVSSTIIVVATNAADGASLSMAGTAGAASIEFRRGGDQWVAAGATVTISGSTISYDGVALKAGGDPPEAQISLEVVCQ